MIFEDGVSLGILFEGRAFDDCQGQGLSIQVKVQRVYAGMPVQRTQCADGQRHRLSWLGRAGGAATGQLDRPRRDKTPRQIQQALRFDRPAQVGFSSGGLAPFPFMRVSTGTVSVSRAEAGDFPLRRNGQNEK